MAYLNLYLTSGIELKKEDVEKTGLLFNPKFPQNWTNNQMKTLDMLLSNCVKYEGQTILYEQRRSKMEAVRYNPRRLGRTTLVDRESGVLWKLVGMKLLHQKTGTNVYKEKKALLSEF